MKQSVYPNEIIIIDASTNLETEVAFKENPFRNLRFFKVGDADRGLTKQRNYGIERVSGESDIVFFLDDDIILEPNYFEQILETYKKHPDALGVGGYIINEVKWQELVDNQTANANQFTYDGFVRKDGSRFVLRKKLGLDADRPPAHLPEFSHGRSVSFLPPSGKIYPVEQFMGGVSSFRKKVLEEHKFSEYFEGYGLYEDADFTLRIFQKGMLYVNTAAQVQHFHDSSGRPDMFKYGKMVVRNGWYVWRVRYPEPSAKAKLKWHATSFLLTLVRFSNVLTSNKKAEAFNEASGRTIGWWSLLFNKPKHT